MQCLSRSLRRVRPILYIDLRFQSFSVGHPVITPGYSPSERQAAICFPLMGSPADVLRQEFISRRRMKVSVYVWRKIKNTVVWHLSRGIYSLPYRTENSKRSQNATVKFRRVNQHAHAHAKAHIDSRNAPMSSYPLSLRSISSGQIVLLSQNSCQTPTLTLF